ncbi:MAG: dihydroorotase [Pseudomonadales bacterium]|nr:dihydroorotase [Pseudomonadales bacterium]
MSSLLITNALVINENKQSELDIFIEQGRISKIGPDLSSLKADKVIDAKGKIAMPGMIDDQVHFREPGLTHKADMGTESRAAVAGGITSFMEMPNCNPLTINNDALRNKRGLAATKSVANYGFYMGATNDNLEDIKRLDTSLACGIKVFMGASTGNMLVDDKKVLEQIFQNSAILIATHCEDTPMILANEAEYREKYGDDVALSMHPLIRSEAACYKSSSFAVELAKANDARLHVLHITTEKELSLFTAGDATKKRITAEACVHHLYFNEADYETLGALIKCNPAIKKASDQNAILDAVNSDIIDVIATDHAPHTWDEKQEKYFKAPSGLPLVQDALLALFEHYHDGRMTLETIVNKTSHTVADIFFVKDRGYIREGYWADIVLVDIDKPHAGYQDSATPILSKCKWTPFKDVKFRSSIYATLVNGVLMYQGGNLVNEVVASPLEYVRD